MIGTRRGVVTKLRNGFGNGSYKKAAKKFAKENKLIYFESINPDGQPLPVVRGAKMSLDQVDANYCFGTHAGYDVVLADRTATVKYEGYKSTPHHWYVLQVDLHKANVPYMFIGTRQQTKAFYAGVLSAHRELRYLTLASSADRAAAFHGHYAVLASPAQTQLLYQLLDERMINILGGHKYPFAMEFDGDSLYIMTDTKKASQQLLAKLLHYGLWLAKEVDQRLS